MQMRQAGEPGYGPSNTFQGQAAAPEGHKSCTNHSRCHIANVLLGCRVFPSEMDPRSHPLWHLAETYGACCELQCSERTTHVVAAARGTEKTMWAVQHGKPVVTPAW